MCGVVAYTGELNLKKTLVFKLRMLEHRGYDSAGIAVNTGSGIVATKRVGDIQGLIELVDYEANLYNGTAGIGHTRWATHGKPTLENAHPHVSYDSRFAIVHNGIIENYIELKEMLAGYSIALKSETDSEIIAHLIALHADKTGDTVEAINEAMKLIVGTYGLAILAAHEPTTIYGTCHGSTLIFGVDSDGYYLVSDKNALFGNSYECMWLRDKQVCVADGSPEKRHYEFYNPDKSISTMVGTELDLSYDDVELGEERHYMLKEIHEQSRSLTNTLRGRIHDNKIHFGVLQLLRHRLDGTKRIILTGCGTSYYAALVGECLFEDIARIPTEVEYASEFRYRNAPLMNWTLPIVISQSGETADTLGVLRELAKDRLVLSICNVVNSTIARESDGGIYLHAGPEIGVASTKTFTSEVLVLAMLAINFGQNRVKVHEYDHEPRLSDYDSSILLASLQEMPGLVEAAMSCEDECRRIAENYFKLSNFLYLGRSYLYPVALEGALKLKEIAYVHTTASPAAEIKHGPIALVDKNTPTIMVMPDKTDVLYPKCLNTINEIKARSGPVIAVACYGDEGIASCVDEVIYVPSCDRHFQPIVSVIPLQLFAYYMAILRGCNVDKPRNLAKSVTVE